MAGQRPTQRAGLVLHAGMCQRRDEIEVAILAQIEADESPTRTDDPAYGEGLKAVIPIALEHCLDSIKREMSSPPLSVPEALLSQARVAARNEVGLEIVLRRYFAGYALFSGFLVDQVEASGLCHGAELNRLLRTLSSNFDRMLDTIGEEYLREEANLERCKARRPDQLIERLLAGEPLDAIELGYDLDAHHLGMTASGPGTTAVLRDLATVLDLRLISFDRGEGILWAWLGGRKEIDARDAIERIRTDLPRDLRFAIGEPARGRDGWRLTHRQAEAALPIAIRGRRAVVRYAEVALLANALKDKLFASSLHELYLRPLEGEHDGGRAMRQTLRAYLAASNNVSSAAASLSISRNTVVKRLRRAEEVIGRPLKSSSAQLECALRLEDHFSERNLAALTGIT